MASSTDDEESGQLREQAETSSRGHAPSAEPGPLPTSAGVSYDDVDVDEDDDEPPPSAAQSPLRVWLGLFGRLLVSVASLLVTATLFVLYPVYCLIPRFLLEALFKGVFRIGCVTQPTGSGERTQRARHSLAAGADGPSAGT